MIKKITQNARMNSRDEAHIGLFRLIQIVYFKVNEMIDVVNKLDKKIEDRRYKE